MVERRRGRARGAPHCAVRTAAAVVPEPDAGAHALGLTKPTNVANVNELTLRSRLKNGGMGKN